MSIDWAHFTPGASLAGGTVLGLAAALMMLLSGRILGVSGIAGRLLTSRAGDRAWRVAFLAGLLAAPLAWSLVAPATPARFEAGPAVLVAAGLLVGWGARRGSGCTSGHGVCGLSRLSSRSLVATLTFMAAGFGTVFVIRHILGGLG